MTQRELAARLESTIGVVGDFPEPGMRFRDIRPVLGDATLYHEAIDALASQLRSLNTPVSCIAAIEARGLVIGSALASVLRCRLVMIRKPSRMPGEMRAVYYEKEHGWTRLEVPAKGAFQPREAVVVVDDILATGSTAFAAGRLVEDSGATVLCYAFLVELENLGGRARLKDSRVLSLHRTT